ncbi:MAG: copper amine oxidase N-terminal domain-containing protein, partial [Candidatus Omnitrophica bacterium]|nr:copper amine oxidase N-terminal domain-containing protein [Candidatus Omnitrophota bacterium]
MTFRKPLLLTTCCLLPAILLIGCASVPTKESLTKYSLHGTTYFSLPELCKLRGVNLEYDSISRTAVLSRDSHKINLMVQDNLALVNGVAKLLDKPIELYQYIVVVPESFKVDIFDVYFKKAVLSNTAPSSLSKLKKIVI